MQQKTAGVGQMFARNAVGCIQFLCCKIAIDVIVFGNHNLPFLSMQVPKGSIQNKKWICIQGEPTELQ